ncbi:hypothetical protein I316_05035 [Kwoniella heveanensis BCC8398]|uniref:GDP/GTP exchange factor Sec2 N-terminal domain-containing protein n=1 Tax=Kwoniella heveanensis BCC8398 TaxID=1296120 RepID=A0A1B9GQB4_9TREE|nr:hypothetical protein I316_05035 [Kwoniella heveanensis BCC8398]
MMHNSGMPSMAYYSYSAQPSPAEDSADQEFQFPTVTIPPRLKSIGRKISQMSNDFLPPGTPEDEEQKTFPSSPLARKADIPPVDDVPGMGDEPVMCPFCEKPLPPSLLAAQLTSGKGEHAHRNSSRQSQPPSSLRRTPSTRTGTPTPSAPLSRVTSATNPNATPASSSSRPQSSALEPKALLDALPVTTPDASTSKSVDPASLSPALPSASSESFAETVKEGDVANHTAAEKFITEDELKRWSTLSGISLPSTSSSVSKATSSSAAGAESQSRTEEAKPAPETKAFPLLPPPPPGGKLLKSSPSQASLRSDKAASGSSSRFNFFRRDSQQNNGAEDESDEDDDGVPASGYAKLTEPGSLSDSEGEEGLSRRIENARKKLESEKVQEQEQEAAKAPEQEAEETTEAQPSPVAGERDKKKGPAVREASEALSSGKDDEIRTVLQEVLGRINEMVSRIMLSDAEVEADTFDGTQSQSQTALLASHSTLLTSLKIARSNLAMAEANSEMLEAQLKRISAAPPSASGSISRGPAGRNVSGPAATPGTPHSSLAPRASGEHVRTTTTANAVASPASTARTPARASMEERPRPMSLHVTASDLLNAGSSASAPSSANADSKSWGFWNGGKKKVAGAFNQIQIPASTSAIGGGGPPSRPGTPSAERASFDSSRPPVPFFSEPSGAPVARTIVRPTPTAHSNLSKSLNIQPGGLSRSMSTTNVPSQRSASGPAPVSSQELATLRQAYSAAVAKMDGMSKELAELKKGKVEMEAELENLSQALFEEANKMVADERRKRAEMEENLKEVREEREALKQTIKVLGGKVEDEDKDGGKGDHSEEIQVGKSGTGEDGEAKVEGAEEEGTTFVPRDLDKHYEALSKAIHHVSSGADLHSSQTIDNDAANNGSAATPFVAEPVPLTPSLGGIVPIPELGQAMNIPSISSSRTSTTDDSGLEFGRGKGVSMSLPAEANPWATSAGSAFSSSSTAAAATPLINVKAATPSPQPHLPGLPEMDLESELEKKEDKVDDKAGEGEAPSGLGLDIDKGVVAGIEEQKE